MKSQVKAGAILQYVQMALQIIINLLYTPIMIRILGDGEYGIYSLASSIISYLNLLTLGFGASYIRFYSVQKQKGDDDAIKRLNGLYLMVFSVMGLVALAAGLVIAFNVGIFFNETYTEHDLYIAKILMIFLSVNLAESFVASVFTSYITSQEKFIFQKIVNMGKTVLSPALCIAALFLGYASIGMVIVTTCVTFLIDFINIGFSVGKLKMRFSLRNPDWHLLKDIAVFSVFIAIHQIIDQVNWQAGKLILGKMMSATAVAVYTVSVTVNSMYLNFSSAVSSVFTPRVNRIISEKPDGWKEEINLLFQKVGRVQFLILGLILTGFIFFGQYFISIWAGEGYELAYYTALLLICPATISLVQNLGIEIQRARNQHQFRSIAYLIMAVVNVGLSILFCHYWGIVGTAMGTAVSLIVANGIIMNVYYQKRLDMNIGQFWLQIVKIFPGLILPVVAGILIMVFVEITSIWMFLGIVLGYALLYCISMWFFGMNKYERELIKKPLRKIFKRGDHAENNG